MAAGFSISAQETGNFKFNSNKKNMKRNFNFPLLNYKGEVIKDENGNNQLMSDIVSLRLFAVGNSDSPASPEKKMQAYRVMKRIQAKPEEVELSAEDAVLIKEIAKDTMVSGIYGQLVDVLEGD